MLPEDNIAGTVSFPSFNQRIVPCDGFLHYVMPATEFADLGHKDKNKRTGMWTALEGYYFQICVSVLYKKFPDFLGNFLLGSSIA